MKIKVIGGQKEKQKLAKKIIRWTAKQLIHKNIREELSIGLTITDDCGQDGVDADVLPTSFEKCPRDFEMRVHLSLDYDSFIRALMHEIVHVKQFTMDELREKNCSIIWLYHGKKYDTSKLDYYELPWEWEAIGREEGLFRKYKKKNLSSS